MNAHQCGRSCRSSICCETKQVARVHDSCSVYVLVQSRMHLSKFQVNPIRFQVVVATRIGNTKRGVIASVAGVQTFHTCSKRPKESQNRSRERRRRPSRVPTALRQTWDRAGGLFQRCVAGHLRPVPLHGTINFFIPELRGS